MPKESKKDNAAMDKTRIRKKDNDIQVIKRKFRN